ncbi:sugar transferase [Fibrobacterota bacterium]
MSAKRVFKLKHFQSILAILTLTTDILSILLSFLCAYFLWGLIGPQLAIDMYEKLEISRYSLLFGVTLITILIGFEVHDLYHPQRSMLNIREFRLILRTWMMACGITMVILYMADEFYFSRGIFMLTWVIMLLFLMLERYGFFKFITLLSSLGIVETTVIIYGTGILARQLITKFQQSPKLGYQVAGFVDDNPTDEQVLGIPVLGDFSRLKEIIREVHAEKLFIALSHVSSEKVVKILNVCRETGCKFQIIPSIYETVLERVRLTDVEGVPLIGVQEPKITLLKFIIKRTFDIFMSAGILIFFFPFALLTAFLIVFLYRKPVFNNRIIIGRNKKAFALYGFTTQLEPEQSSENTIDTSMKSRCARILKKTGIFRYPQFINVLKGNMSLVGPRAEDHSVVAAYNDIQKHKLNVSPGITGLWEISTQRESTFYQDKDLDIYYIQNQSIFLDIIILIKKLFSFFTRRSPG